MYKTVPGGGGGGGGSIASSRSTCVGFVEWQSACNQYYAKQKGAWDSSNGSYLIPYSRVEYHIPYFFLRLTICPRGYMTSKRRITVVNSTSLRRHVPA